MITTKRRDRRPTAADPRLVLFQGLNMVATQSGNPDPSPATLSWRVHDAVEREKGFNRLSIRSSHVLVLLLPSAKTFFSSLKFIKNWLSFVGLNAILLRQEMLNLWIRFAFTAILHLVTLPVILT